MMDMIIVYRKKISVFFSIFLIQAFTLLLFAQYPVNYQYTLLQSDIVDEIIGASSGELALRHIIELAPYTQPRYDREFSGNFRETDYVLSVLNKYGLNHSLDNVGEIDTWRGLQGTLWEISPRREKIADFNEVPEMLVEGSQPADLSAELIWVGDGSPVLIEANREKIKGKIIVTSGSTYSVHLRALNAGAVGTISYYSSRPLVDPIQMPNTSIPAKGFAFLLPPREGEILRDRLLRGETIKVSVKIESKTEQAKLQVPWCIIPGTDPDAGEIIFTAHLFEGYTKMGANDNMSGSAVLLEVAHVLNDLIEAGKINRPVRTIRFLWVPEFDGTIPWVNQNLQKVKKAVCDINLDMVGINLRANKSFMCLHKSGFSTAHYVNDVMENYFRYVGETNVEGITDQLGRRGFSRRIVAPTGTDDPFYYRILSLHGSSDNAVFNDWSINIPGVKLITWPDNYYHSSEDNPDKCDPTQLRRIIFISAASAYTMASADEKMAVRILSEMFAGATVRMGIQMAKSSDMVNKADATKLPAAYKRACYNLEGTAMAEKSAMDKVRQLSDRPEVVEMIEVRKKDLDNLLQTHLSALKELMINRTRYMKIPQINLSPDSLEKKAMKIVPSVTDKALNMGYGGEWNYISALSSDFLSKNYYGNIVNTSEAAGLADGKRNLLDIKKMVDAQFEKESPLQDIINYYIVLKEAGLMKY
ncbi:MAG TPA: DUF4910 domain-containing protein [Bacteroidales bacterium]|nr:hypothetical protein [Bacteroidales bacterium]HQG36579.1 DUF4910 domain-containing protein [Bacteroidales bacterium]HQG52916.1 DUF4910 domain-containing protein [Bacteroidales bacterium]HQJ21274.1 DUF4910 domain-containing protein [Bacteroidales bacterium]